mgnify:CR=1 FL=1
MSTLPSSGNTEERLIAGPAGRIEALVSAPQQPLRQPAFAIVCHPHPLFGGAMSNKVAYMLASSAQKAGLYALRFNFRGVGRSEGAHDAGRGETDDVEFLVARSFDRYFDTGGLFGTVEEALRQKGDKAEAWVPVKLLAEDGTLVTEVRALDDPWGDERRVMAAARVGRAG